MGMVFRLHFCVMADTENGRRIKLPELWSGVWGPSHPLPYSGRYFVDKQQVCGGNVASGDCPKQGLR